MKSFVLLSLLIILVLVDFSSSQTCRSLTFWQRPTGDSNCGRTEYLKGFYRDVNQGDKDVIDLLRSASCCTAPPPDENHTKNCTAISLWSELDYDNVWAKCPPGMLMQGVKRTTSLHSWLSNIEGIICCHPKTDVAPSYEDCYEKNVDVLFNDKGWTMCDADYYLAGFYRGNCKLLSCLDRFKCCKFMPRACGQPLVGPVEGPVIRDSSITASSKRIPSAKIGEARIGGNDGWSPHPSDKLPYLQFDLEKLYLVCGFEVLGCKGSHVNLYRVHVSPEKEYLDSWNIIKPEFYGTDAEDKRAYRQARVRKLGRYVRIFPRNVDPDIPITCMQVEIYGEPYIKIYQDAFFIHNEGVMSYKKGRPTKFKRNNIVVEEYENPDKLKTRISDGLLHYTKVVPSRIPWEEELSVDTCVIAPNPVEGRKDFLSGRVHKVYKVKKKYAVKYLAKAKAVVVKKVLFNREQLQVIYGAWCKIIARVHLNTGKKTNSRCRGDILQIDTQITFRSTALSALKRFSFDEIKNEDYVSREKVVLEKLKKGKTVLLFEGIDKCLRAGTFLYYYSKTGYVFLKGKQRGIKRLYEVHYAKSSTDFDRCGKNENTCWRSRIPFSGVTRFNCSTSKIWKDNDCKDENECHTGMANCGHLAACQNSLGFYKCVCPKGTVQNGNARKRPCSDLDECKTGNACGEGAVCINTPGSFICHCKQGFKMEGFNKCQDIDECQVPANKKSGVCHPTLAKCVDFPGGYKCECKVGYHGDGIKNCKLADECELGIHKCHQWATCINTEKSYDCGCKKGYVGNGFTCKDVDECANNQNDCGFRNDGIECVNTNGSYMCACREGFTGDGKTCINIDECKNGAHDCVKNAICTDREGSFSCKCRFGFYGNATKKCIVNSSPSTKTGKVWIFAITMATLSLFTTMI